MWLNQWCDFVVRVSGSVQETSLQTVTIFAFSLGDTSDRNFTSALKSKYVHEYETSLTTQ